MSVDEIFSKLKSIMNSKELNLNEKMDTIEKFCRDIDNINGDLNFSTTKKTFSIIILFNEYVINIYGLENKFNSLISKKVIKQPKEIKPDDVSPITVDTKSMNKTTEAIEKEKKKTKKIKHRDNKNTDIPKVDKRVSTPPL